MNTSTNANTFNFTQTLGKVGQDAQNEQFVKLALSGRVHTTLLDVCGVYGLDDLANNPDKKSFEKYSKELLTMGKPKGLPLAMGRRIAQCCEMIRNIMGLPEVTINPWIKPQTKPHTKRAAKVSAADTDTHTTAPTTMTAADILAIIRSDVFTESELDEIIGAARAAIPALV